MFYMVNHILLNVKYMKRPVWVKPSCDRQRIVSCSRADLKDALARLRGENRLQPRSSDYGSWELNPESL